MPNVVGRPAQLHSPQSELLAPFAASSKSFPRSEVQVYSGKVVYLAPTPFVSGPPVPERTTDVVDQQRSLSTSAENSLLLPARDCLSSTATVASMGAPSVSLPGATSGTIEDGVVATGVMPSGTPRPKTREIAAWSLSPHRARRRPLKPLHTSPAVVSTGAMLHPTAGLPLSSSFSHKFRRRLQDAPEEWGGSSGYAQSKGTNMTGSDIAAAAAAAIAATVSTFTGAEGALKKPGLLRRCVSLVEDSLSAGHPSAVDGQQEPGEGDAPRSIGTPYILSRRTSWSPGSNCDGQLAEQPPAFPIPLLRRGPTAAITSTQLGIASRSGSERGSIGEGSSLTAKGPVAPSIRLASASPTMSSSKDVLRPPLRSPSICSTSDTDPEGSRFHADDDAYAVVSGSGYGVVDGTPPSPLLRSYRATINAPNDVTRGGRSTGHDGLRTSRRAKGVGTGCAQRPRQEPPHGLEECAVLSASGGCDPPEFSLEDADTPKLTSRKSHFGGNTLSHEGPPSRRNSSGKSRENRDSEGKGRSRRNSDHSERRKHTVRSSTDGPVAVPARASLASVDRSPLIKRELPLDGERDKPEHCREPVGPSPAPSSGVRGYTRHVVEPTTPKADGCCLPDAATPRRGSCGRMVDGRVHRHSSGNGGGKAGGGNGAGSLTAASSECAGGVTTTKPSKESLLVRRNDSILKSLLSGSPSSVAGFPGEDIGTEFSYEFGLWKKAKNVPAASTVASKGGVEAALPPPPVRGLGTDNFTPHLRQAVVATERASTGTHGSGDASGRLSLEALYTIPPPDRTNVGSRRPSPPLSRMPASALRVCTALPTSTQQEEKGGAHSPTGAGNAKPAQPDPDVRGGVPATTPSAESTRSEGIHGSFSDTSAPSSLFRGGISSQKHESPALPSPRLSPRAARARTRLCAEAPSQKDTRRLLGLKASPPPSGRRFSSGMRLERGEARLGRAEEHGGERDLGSSTSSCNSLRSVNSRGPGSPIDVAKTVNMQAMAPIRRPPSLVLGGNRYDDARENSSRHALYSKSVSPAVEAALNVPPLTCAPCSQGAATLPLHNNRRTASADEVASAEVTDALPAASNSTYRCQSGDGDVSADAPESLSVEISEDLSEGLESRNQSQGSRYSTASESYGEDSQWTAHKGYRKCVSRHRLHAIHWKRGEEIGTGSFGKVFKGLNEATGELFAVKQLDLRHGNQEEMNALETEIDLMKDLNHRHIVRYCGTDRGRRHLYIFLEYIPGGSIASMLQHFGVFREDLVRRFVHQILLGMRYLHDKGIIHRDIKGANVLVTEQGIAKLADFGCSKQFQGVRTPSFDDSLYTMRGSVPWMAPEMVKQTGHGRSADVWSLGATMIEMLTARYPWPPFSNNIAAMYHVATATEPPAFPEDVTAEGKDFLSNCLIIDPDSRLKASELLQHAFLDGAAAELEASSGQGPGGFGSSSGIVEKTPDEA